ncbi:MAG: CCA tRNA nucleotidyltransferase [Acidimicrobiales bacterium]
MPATRSKIGGTCIHSVPSCHRELRRQLPSFAVTSFDQVHDRLSDLAHLSSPVARAFADAGFSLYAVGGSVRDAILGEERREDFEIDFTTNARPDDIVALMTPLCSTLWEQGRDFGTVGGLLRYSGIKVEITTFRSEAYVDHSRKPAVEWGDSLEADLGRRDFTMNALALDVVALEAATPDVQTLFDFYDGFNDLHERVLRTPIDPEILFSDDPLRMLRAARFAARFSLAIDPAIEAATVKMADRLTKVSPERIRGELDLLMMTVRPSIGLDYIVRTGLAEVFFPELPKLQLEQDPIHRHKDVLAHTWAVVDKTSPDLVLRLAALFHDIGKPTTRAITDDGVTFRFHEVVGAKMTRKRMTALRYSQEMIEDVSALVELHLRFHTYKLGWSDKAVRRYVRDAGPLLEELNELTRCDCTTRNARKAAELADRMDELEIRIADLREREDLERLRPALDGVAVMELLDIPPSPAVGRALEFLMEIRLDEGEITPQEAGVRLREWWADQA